MAVNVNFERRNRIMGFDRIRIKENAKKHYELNKWQNVLVCLVAGLISGGIQFVVNISERSGAAGIILGLGLIGLAAGLLVVNVISMGGATWFHRSIKQEGLRMEEMFWTFREDYGGNVLMMFLIGLYTVLWSLLFVIPGIIKAYSYSLAPYIKSENPNISASKAIELSKTMTNGHKMDLFVLGLSFIGWQLLNGLTFGILGIIYVNPYFNAAQAFAYEEIKEDAIASGRISESDLYGYGE